MVPPNLIFWSISGKKSLESQQKHAFRNRFLRTILCSNDILKPGYNRKMPMRKRTSILDRVCFNFEKLFHPVEKFLGEDKVIVQSPDPANNSLELNQSRISSQVLQRFVIELLQQHWVILHVLWILTNSEIQSPGRSLHNQSLHRTKILGPSSVCKLARLNSNTRLEIDFFE